MDYNEAPCFCGSTAFLDSYEEAGETWYFYECPVCGRSNRLHYNYIKDAYDAWISGDVIMYDANPNFFWNLRN